MADRKISDLSATTYIQDDDAFVIARDSDNYKMPLSQVRSQWRLIPTTEYASAASADQEIAQNGSGSPDLGSYLAAGLPVKWTVGGTSYYGIVTAYNASTDKATIAGAPLASGATITALHVGLPSMVVTRRWQVDGAVSDATDYSMGFWLGKQAYLVYAVAFTASGTGDLAIKSDGTIVTLSSVSSTAVASTTVDATYYQTDFGYLVEITPASTSSMNGPRLEAVFVMEDTASEGV